MENYYQPVSGPISMKNLKKYEKKEDAICKLIIDEKRGTGFFLSNNN